MQLQSYGLCVNLAVAKVKCYQFPDLKRSKTYWHHSIKQQDDDFGPWKVCHNDLDELGKGKLTGPATNSQSFPIKSSRLFMVTTF